MTDSLQNLIAAQGDAVIPNLRYADLAAPTASYVIDKRSTRVPFLAPIYSPTNVSVARAIIADPGFFGSRLGLFVRGGAQQGPYRKPSAHAADRPGGSLFTRPIVEWHGAGGCAGIRQSRPAFFTKSNLSQRKRKFASLVSAWRTKRSNNLKLPH